jgi:hypothetical protein
MYSPSVASFDQTTMKCIGYEIPEKVHEYAFNGEMAHCSGKVDLQVTKNHNLFCSTSGSVIRRLNPSYILVQADKLNRNDKPAYKSPMRMRVVSLGVVNDNFSGMYMKFGDNYVDFARLVGFFIGDGYAYSSSKNSIYFHLKRDRKVKYLVDTCNKLGLYMYINEKNNSYRVSSPGIGTFFSDTCYSDRDKVIPHMFFNAKQEEVDGLLDGLKNSDGSIKRNTWVYDTTSEKLANQLQALGFIYGYSFSINSPDDYLYRLNLNSYLDVHINDSRTTTKFTDVGYNGKIYCVSVSTGLVCVRRGNGLPVLCGNSPFEHLAVWEKNPIVNALCSREDDVKDGYGWSNARGYLEDYNTVPPLTNTDKVV